MNRRSILKSAIGACAALLFPWRKASAEEDWSEFIITLDANEWKIRTADNDVASVTFNGHEMSERPEVVYGNEWRCFNWNEEAASQPHEGPQDAGIRFRVVNAHEIQLDYVFSECMVFGYNERCRPTLLPTISDTK